MDENRVQLTSGAIQQICNFVEVAKPVLRLTDFQQGSSSDPKSMFVVELSDGVSSYDNCVVNSPQLIQRLYSGEFPKSSVVVLNDYHFNKLVQFIYIKDMSKVEEVLQCVAHQNNTSPLPNDSLTTGPMISDPMPSDPMPNDELPTDPLHTSPSHTSPSHAGPSHTSPLPTSPLPSSSSSPQQQNIENMEVESVSIQKTPHKRKATPNQSIPTESQLTDTPPLGPSDVSQINTITINSISWVIRGRITSKGKIRQYSNQNGKGTVFSFVMTDQSGDIRLNVFNRQCDKYFGLIEENKVYRISDGKIKMANKRYSNISNDYEIILTSDSKVVECPPEESFSVRVCKPHYRFVSIKDLEEKPIGSVVDVIAAVKEVGQCYFKKTITGTLATRDIILVDSTEAEIDLTLWKEMAEQFECQQNAIIAVQNAVIKDFGGRSLSTYPNTYIKIEPEDVVEANPIKEWLSSRREVHNTANQSLTAEVITTADQIRTSDNPCNISLKIKSHNSAGRIKVVLLDQITEQSIGVQKQSIYYVKARVVFPISRSPLYKSCHRFRCFKKVQELSNGVYRCVKCVEETARFQWRLFIAAIIIDSMTERWIHLFDSEAARLIGCTAQQLSQFSEQEQYEKVLHSIEYKKFLWKIDAKLQIYLNKTELKLNIKDFWPLDPIKDSKEMIANIRKLTQNNR